MVTMYTLDLGIVCHHWVLMMMLMMPTFTSLLRSSRLDVDAELLRLRKWNRRLVVVIVHGIVGVVVVVVVVNINFDEYVYVYVFKLY